MLAPDPDARLPIPRSDALVRRLLLANLLTTLAPIGAAGLAALAETEVVVGEAVVSAALAVGLGRRFDSAERLLDPLGLVLISGGEPLAPIVELAKRGTMMRSVWCLHPRLPLIDTHQRHGESWLSREHGGTELISDPVFGRAVPVAAIYRDIG
jgi:hypothetical protein